MIDLAHGIGNSPAAASVYVQSAKLDGRPLKHPWITHDEIVHGGTLDLEMDVMPKKGWETGE